MSILADIEDLEAAIAAILESVPADFDSTRVTFRDAVVEAMLSILDERDLDELADVDLELAVEEALRDVFDDLDDAVNIGISRRLRDMVEATEKFYSDRGIELPGLREAVRRSETTRELTELFSRSMRIRREDLFSETIAAMQNAILKGDVDRVAITDQVGQRADVAVNLIEAQVETSISAYNQHYRNELAERAELEHFLYFGTLKETSRIFCRILIDKVYTADQVDGMDNGMLNPVKVFKGGYRCRHSWLPVDPQWDDELTDRIADGEFVTIDLDEDGRRSITVVATEEEAQSIMQQIVDARRGATREEPVSD